MLPETENVHFFGGSQMAAELAGPGYFPFVGLGGVRVA